MPSGSALKLGDVLTIRNGKTVEIHNTDAEGRLVLADGLSLAVEEQADAIVDIATLTGAVLGALGKKVAGVLGNDQALGGPGLGASRSGPTSGSGSCRWSTTTASCSTPTWPTSRTSVVPTAAPSRPALFLREFVGDVPWAHLDIAGVDGQRRRRRHLLEGRHRLRRAALRRPPGQLPRRRRISSIRPTPARSCRPGPGGWPRRRPAGGTPTSASWRSTSSGSSPAVSMVWAMASRAPADVLGERRARWGRPSRRGPAAGRSAAAGPGGG